MPVFHYVALDRSGNRLKGEVQAQDEVAARREVRSRGLYVESMDPEASRFRLRLPFSRKVQDSPSQIRVSQKELVFFTRQFATLLNSGFTLASSLGAIAEQVPTPAFKKAILDIDRMIREGKTLHESLRLYPGLFSDIYCSLVRAGEASGELPSILVKLSEYSEKQNQLKNKVLATLAYPAVMVIVAVAVVFILMTKVVPEIITVVQGSGQELPDSTEALIAISGFLSAWWLAILGASLLLAMAFQIWKKTANGRRMVDRLVLRIPLFGTLITKIAISRFASTLAVLLRSGVDILKSLGIAKDVVGNVCYMAAIERAATSLGEGESMSKPLKDSGLFPPIVVRMLESGQKSGSLEVMLDAIARDYENETESTLLAMTSMLEPILLLVMGSVVGFIVMAVLTPLQNMGGGG